MHPLEAAKLRQDTEARFKARPGAPKVAPRMPREPQGTIPLFVPHMYGGVFFWGGLQCSFKTTKKGVPLNKIHMHMGGVVVVFLRRYLPTV